MGKSKRVRNNSKKIMTRSQNSLVKKHPELIDLACSSHAIPEIITLDSINSQKKGLSNTCQIIDLEDDDIAVLPTRIAGHKLKDRGRNSSNKDVCIEEDAIYPVAKTNSQSTRQFGNEMSIVPFQRELSDLTILPNPKNTSLSFPKSKCLALLPASSAPSHDEHPDSIINSLPQRLVPNPSPVAVAGSSLNLMDCASPSKTKIHSQLCVSGNPSSNFSPYKRPFDLPGQDEINRIKKESSTVAALSNNPSTNPLPILDNPATSSSVIKTREKRSVKQSIAANTNGRYALRSRGPPVSVSRKSVVKNNQNKKLVANQGKNKLKSLNKTSNASRNSGSSFQSNSVNVQSNAEESQQIKAVVYDSVSASAVRTNSAGRSNVKPKAELSSSLNKEKKGKMSLKSGAFDQELDFIPIPSTPRHIERELVKVFAKNKKKGAFRAKRNKNLKNKYLSAEGAFLDEIEYPIENEFSNESGVPKSRRQIKRLRRKIVRAQARKIIRERRKKKGNEELGKPQSKKLNGLKASKKISRSRKNLNDIQSMKVFGKKQCLEPTHLKNVSSKQRIKLKRKLRNQKQKLKRQLNKLNHGKSQKQKLIQPKLRNLKKSEMEIEGENYYHSTPFSKKLRRCSESPMNLSRSFSDFNWITLDACQTDFNYQSSEASNEDFDRSDLGPSCSKFSTAGVTNRSHSRRSRLRSESEESCQEVPLSPKTMDDNDIILIDDGEKLGSDDAISDAPVADDSISLSSEELFSKQPVADDAASLSSEESFSMQPIADDAVSLSSEESFSIDIGTNVFVPGGVSFKGRRPVIIDGSNVAIAHGLSTRGKRVFSSKGLEICAKFFTKRGHKVIVFVPLFRRWDRKTLNPEVLQKMSDKGLMTYTPSRKLNKKMSVPYDDRYIVQCAVALGGVIVSTDNYKDLLKENRTWKSTIEKRLLMFTFVGDMLMFPQDPLGRHGPKLDDFLMFPR